MQWKYPFEVVMANKGSSRGTGVMASLWNISIEVYVSLDLLIVSWFYNGGRKCPLHPISRGFAIIFVYTFITIYYRSNTQHRGNRVSTCWRLGVSLLSWKWDLDLDCNWTWSKMAWGRFNSRCSKGLPGWVLWGRIELSMEDIHLSTEKRSLWQVFIYPIEHFASQPSPWYIHTNSQ